MVPDFVHAPTVVFTSRFLALMLSFPTIFYEVCELRRSFIDSWMTVSGLDTVYGQLEIGSVLTPYFYSLGEFGASLSAPNKPCHMASIMKTRFTTWRRHEVALTCTRTLSRSWCLTNLRCCAQYCVADDINVFTRRNDLVYAAAQFLTTWYAPHFQHGEMAMFIAQVATVSTDEEWRAHLARAIRYLTLLV
jgi:hypothetical protein